jgi:hypothetical protein
MIPRLYHFTFFLLDALGSISFVRNIDEGMLFSVLVGCTPLSGDIAYLYQRSMVHVPSDIYVDSCSPLGLHKSVVSRVL